MARWSTEPAEPDDLGRREAAVKFGWVVIAFELLRLSALNQLFSHRLFRNAVWVTLREGILFAAEFNGDINTIQEWS